MQRKTYTVTQITENIKYLLEGHSSFQGFVLKGEISNFTRHFTGHLYFSLKDENAQIRAIMFKNAAEKLSFKPKNGDKVEITGSLSVYPPQGSYSVQITTMKEAGEGELYKKYLELKNSLKELGWFDKERKLLPKFPKRIGVVTSATGAVIQDITNTINRRYLLTEIILYSAPVQGTGASEIIAKQIKRANEEQIVDLLIVGRGGGSMEDLWQFNEIAVIEAIYSSKIPIITAIGHETDTTLSDYVSDLRAPTPTAAAELATPNQLDLVIDIKNNLNRINHLYQALIRNNQTNLVHLSERLEQSSPLNKIKNNLERLVNNKKLLNYYIEDRINEQNNYLKELNLRLKNASPSVKLKISYERINDIKVKIQNSYYYRIETEKYRLNSLINRIKSPEDLITNYLSNNKKLTKQLNLNYQNVINNKNNIYNYNINILRKINPLAIMERGFAIIKSDNKEILTTVNDISINQLINIELIDGLLETKVINKKIKE